MELLKAPQLGLEGRACWREMNVAETDDVQITNHKTVMYITIPKNVIQAEFVEKTN